MSRFLTFLLVLLLPAPVLAQSKDANRLAYLDEVNPYYPSRTFPKLITPQWIGEPGVEAAVILAIDDMKDPKRYEAFLRPILRRLQKIDGRAPVSIMSCAVDPKDQQLQTWLKEGLSIECHTYDHPCPFFKGGFDKAKATYDKCVDLMHEIPNSKPVAFRMPCCDSLNTVSPRFFTEIFNKTTKKGNFLQIDSSVFNVFTSNDPDLPRALVQNADGSERFRKYLPKDRSFVNYIEDYPYPYVIGRLCWQFPCATPSDWQAQHLHKPNNPQTVKDWKAALDCTVIKKGVFCLVFHPHGWIRNDQVVELIDYAAAKYGKKVKFLNFREALERLDKSLFEGKSLRALRNTPQTRVVIGDSPGLISVSVHRVEGKTEHTSMRIWGGFLNPGGGWKTTIIKTRIPDGYKVPLDANRNTDSVWLPWPDRRSELLIVRGFQHHAVIWDEKRMPFSLPPGARLADADGKDAGLRFLDLDGDGKLDLIFSNEKEYGIYLFVDMKTGWSKKVMAGKRDDKDALPMISRNGTNNGFWVHSGNLWWSNEDTVLLKDHVDRRSIKELLKGKKE